jgi:hypothetical protein
MNTCLIHFVCACRLHVIGVISFLFLFFLNQAVNGQTKLSFTGAPVIEGTAGAANTYKKPVSIFETLMSIQPVLPSA